jgi:hypothetical protein
MTTTAILFFILCLIAGGTLIFALAPLTFTAEIEISAEGHSGVMHAQWLHPWIVQWKYYVEQRRSEVMVLGKTRMFPDKDRLETKPEKTPVPDRNKRVPVAELPVGTAGIASCKELLIEEDLRIEKKQEKTYQSTETADTDKPSDPRGSGWHKVRHVYSILHDVNNRRAFAKALRWCRRTLGLFFKMIRFYRFRLHAKAGTGDPAETGKIYGYYTALDKFIFSRHQNVDVRLTPEFSIETFECCGSIAVRTSFARVLLPLLTALVTFPYLAAYFVWRRLKKIKSLKNNGARHG